VYSLLNKVPSTNKMIDTTKIIVGMLFLAMAGLLGWYGRASKTGGVVPGPMFVYPPDSPPPVIPGPVVPPPVTPPPVTPGPVVPPPVTPPPVTPGPVVPPPVTPPPVTPGPGTVVAA
jgi:hypothetical protein